MNVNPKMFAVLAILAAGGASAAGTLAGQTIENTATANYNDPITGTATSSTSNTVSTVVLPKPDFDIVYSSGTPDAGTQNALSSTTVVTTGAVPGQRITTPYTVLNNGNVPLTVNIAANTTGAATGQTVAYYPKSADTNSDGILSAAELAAATPITSVNVPADNPATPADEGRVEIFQVITLPTDPAQITSSSVFGGSPEGTVSGTAGADPLVQPGNGYLTGTTNYEQNQAAKTDLQFVKITVYAPALDNNPNTNPSTPVDSQGNPITNPALVPPVTSVNVPTETAGKPGDPTPVVATPGYITPNPPASDPTPGGTPIVPNVAGDEQIAYPKADPNTLPDTVVFTNNLTNTGGATDDVQLFPALPDGTPDPAYVFNAATGTFTNSTTGVSVRFLDPVTGQPIPVSTNPNNPTVAQFPTVTVPNGSTVVYRTEVTYPDPDDSNPILPVSVQIGADSLKDADLVSNSVTKNTIYPPAAQFGDATAALGTSPAPAPVQTVDPSAAAGGISSPDFSDKTAVFPMDVVNNGQYNDSFTLSGSVTVLDAVTNQPVVLPVQYYAPDGSLLPRVSTDPASPDYNRFITPVVAFGSEYKPYAVIQVPAGTKAGDYTVTQNAVGNYSTIPMTDNSDILRVATVGSVQVAKFVAKAGVTAASNPVNGIDNPAGYTATGATGAKPGEDISYKIIGKQTYNTAVPAFYLRDVVPVNTSYKSVALSGAPTAVSKTIYRVNNGVWQATMPAGPLAAGTSIDVAADNNNDNLPDDLQPGESLTADFVVTVN